jgi:hypothetical protein
MHLYKAAKLPKFAAIKGLFPGAIPAELQDLSTVEKSMIALFSPVTTLSLNSGKFDHSEPKTFTLVNDLADVVKQLPNMETLNSYALLRHSSAKQMTDFEYRPNIVKAALFWLKDNNHLYKDIPIVFPLDWQENNTQPRCAPHIEVTGEDLGIDENAVDQGLELPQKNNNTTAEKQSVLQDDTVPTNTGTHGTDEHILLQGVFTVTSVSTSHTNSSSSNRGLPICKPVYTSTFFLGKMLSDVMAIRIRWT